MSTPPELDVVVLAHGDVLEGLRGALATLRCTAVEVADLFDGMAQIEARGPDAVVLDLTSGRDDARALAYWLHDEDVDTVIVGVVEPAEGAAASGLHELCDEVVITPVSRSELAAALGLSFEEETGQERGRLTVRVNAALLDAREVRVPPQRASTDDGEKPALIVGLGADAEIPRHER